MWSCRQPLILLEQFEVCCCPCFQILLVTKEVSPWNNLFKIIFCIFTCNLDVHTYLFALLRLKPFLLLFYFCFQRPWHLAEDQLDWGKTLIYLFVLDLLLLDWYFPNPGDQGHPLNPSGKNHLSTYLLDAWWFHDLPDTPCRAIKHNHEKSFAIPSCI